MNRGNRVVQCVCATVALLAAAAGVALAQQYDPNLIKGMRYRLVGPYRGGRSLSAVGVPSQPHTYYFGAVGGGLWKTTNSGMTWTSLWDNQPVSSVGAIAVADTDPNVIYAGTGEACIRGNISHGDGVYKSLDAGKTWKHIGLKETRNVSKILVHPRNENIVFVAALGHAYGNNPERGLFRSTDGGKTWEKVLYKDQKSGAIDISFTPGNPNVMFAAMWEAGRTGWSLTSGGPGSGLYKSTDGGATWKQITRGLPDLMGKIGVAVSADPNRVYVILEALEEKGGFYRSDDGGESFRQLTDDHRLRQRPWYYTHITADPKNVDTVYVLNTAVLKSTDGGRNFSPVRGIPHGDHHFLWIDPNDSSRMADANDGGGTISVDGGRTWSRQDNIPTAQFYHVTTDDQWPYVIYGSQQDNSSVSIASRSDQGGIGREDYDPVGGGEAGDISATPDGQIVYAGEYFGILTRFDRRTKQAQNVSVWPDDTDGWEAAPLKYRFNWTQPIRVSKFDPNIVYYTGNHVFRTNNGGMSWDVISPDLTRNDKSKQGRSGGPITGENISIEYYNVVFSFAESPHDRNTLWAGADDGLVHLTRDAGKSWQNVTPKDMPEGMVSQIEVSPHDPATMYFALDRHKFDDLAPHIYKTSDYGKTWKKIVNGIAPESFARAVREDPKRKGLLYAGTETGVWVSFDDGANWQKLQLNLPTSPIHDLVVKNDDLVVATHGRSFWVLDDLSPLRQMSDAMSKSEVHLFTPAATTRWRGAGGFGGGQGPPQGENPPRGTVIYYYLKAEQKDEYTLEILDKQNNVVRKFTSREPRREGPPAEEPFRPQAPRTLPSTAGLQRWVWNMQYELPPIAPGVQWDMGEPDMPMALPGNYTVKLTVGGKSYTAPVELKLDPRVKVAPADLDKQYELMTRIRTLLGETHGAVLEIRSLREQMAALPRRFAGNAKYKPLLDSAAAIEKKMFPVEAELIEVYAKSSQDMCNYPTKLSSKIAWLDNVVNSADTAPTKQSYEFYDVLRSMADKELAKWKQIVASDVAALNDIAKKENIPAFAPVPPGSR